MRINQDWIDFKDSVDEKRLFVQYESKENHYVIWATDGMSIYRCIIDITDPAGTDQSDFETNYKPDANRPQTVAESATQSNFIGKQIIIPSGVVPSGTCEWEFDNTVYINKVLPVAHEAEWGDKISFTVHLKSNDYEVGGYAENVYLFGDAPHEWFSGNGGGKIPNYCKVRCTYEKGDGTTNAERKFIVIAEFLT